MALNASIFGNMLAQPKSPEEYLAERQQLEQGKMANMLNQSRFDEMQRATQERNALASLFGRQGFNPSSPEGQAEVMRTAPINGQGIIKGLIDNQKSQADARKVELENASRRLDMAGQALNFVRQNPTLENAHATLDYLGKNGIYSPDQVAQYKAQVAQNPGSIASLAEMAYRSALSAKDQLPKTEMQDTGGASNVLSVDPVSRLVTTLSSTKKTATPGDLIRQENNIRSNARMTQNGAGAAAPASATPAPAPKPAKPLPSAALKMQQESLDAISTSAGINADLGGILGQIQSGKLKLGPVANAVSAGKNFAGMSDTQSQNYASFKASLEKLRNDSLRLNKGVQTDGDAQRAWNELLQNINDPGVVQQRLREIQALNERAIGLHQLNIDTIRNNYGAGPLDTSDRVNPKPAIGAGQPPNAKALSAEDQQAAAWARANPNDPRAALIKQKLGL